MYLKQENFKYETLLERYAEPLSVLAGIFADTAYPDHEITHAWKILLSNQPHDSICGCSVDPVHDEMMLRYRWTHDVVQAILDKAGNALFERKRSEPGAVSGSLVVFNPHLHSGTELVTVELTIDERLLRKVNYETGNLDEFDAGTGKGIPDAVLVRDQSGNQVAGRIISVDDLDDMVLSLHTQPEMFRCKKVRFSFSAKDIPALSFSEYNYEFLYDQPEHPAKPAKAQIENDFFMVRWDAACSALTVEDKRTGFVYEGLNTIEDSGDAGDEYTFSKPRYDTCSYIDAGSASVTTSVHAGSARMVIDAVMRTPEALDADRLHRSATLVDVGIQTCVELTNGIARIDIRTEIDNRARDHRIRVLFPLGGPCAHSSAEGIFSVDDRPATPADPAAFSDWIEPPSTNPQKSFVSALSADKGLSIANRGLPEYELYSDADKNGVLALTLLRGVGWLSRPDLSARKGNGGWTLATPKAQCLGSQVFEYSIIPHKDSWVDADIPALAHSFAVPPMAFSGYGCISGRKIASIVSTNAKHLVLSSVKKSVSGTSYIIRFWNESAEDIDAELSFGIPPVSAWLVDLAETRLRALTVNGMKCSVHCGAWKIVSIELRY